MTPQLYFDKILATNEDVSNALTSDINQMRYILAITVPDKRHSNPGMPVVIPNMYKQINQDNSHLLPNKYRLSDFKADVHKQTKTVTDLSYLVMPF